MIGTRLQRWSEDVDAIRVRTQRVSKSAWHEIGILALQASAIGQVVGGLLAIETAGKGLQSDSPLSIPAMFFGAGLAIIASGLLTFFRRRRQLIHRLLGSLTTGTFALALVFLSRDDGQEAGDGLLLFAFLFAGFLLLTHIFSDLIADEGAL